LAVKENDSLERDYLDRQRRRPVSPASQCE
jgi:hypothetical protein